MSEGRGYSEGKSPKVEFSGLVAGLATSAVAVLSQVEALLQRGDVAEEPAQGVAKAEPLSVDERKKRISDGLAGARQLIDTLIVLEEKTKGNLTDDEQKLLAAAISDLRLHYVGLANRPLPEHEQTEADVG